jgi:hypothetical protein
LNPLPSASIYKSARSLPGLLALVCAIGITACSSPERARERIDPDVARAKIVKLLPSGVSNPTLWAVDIYAAFEALELPASNENVCLAIAVTQQESTFTAQPSVPGLSKIARKEIDTRAAQFRIPKSVVEIALKVRSPNGKTYQERLQKVTTEKELSDIFEDFISSVPLGRQLFSGWNPVRTGGPMQVSIAFAQEHAAEHRYPYPMTTTIRDEVFTRRGGMYFGIAHLLDYSASYDDMIYRVADFNAGHYASRNAAFQRAVSRLSKSELALDGDLLLYGSKAGEPSRTELAVRKLADRLDMNNAQIRSDLEREKQEAFERTKLYKRVLALADEAGGKRAPRGVIPSIQLKSAKITRKLTTEWFAKRVDQRYKQCLARGAKS